MCNGEKKKSEKLWRKSEENKNRKERERAEDAGANSLGLILDDSAHKKKLLKNFRRVEQCNGTGKRNNKRRDPENL